MASVGPFELWKIVRLDYSQLLFRFPFHNVSLLVSLVLV